MSAPTHLAATPTIYEPCEECGAALDPQQRYCVNCAARRGNGANPSSRYFASMSKRARRPVATRPAGKQSSGSRAAAVGFFALLPIAVAIGVVVGRADSGSGDEGALLQALREQGSNGAVASTAEGTTATGANAKAKSKAAKSKGGVEKKSTKPKEQVAAQTKNGTVHKVTGYVPSKKTIEESTKLVEENSDQTGSSYIEDQQNLPDVIPVGSSTETEGGK
jgi:hypothetical protein